MEINNQLINIWWESAQFFYYANDVLYLCICLMIYILKIDFEFRLTKNTDC